MDRWVLYRDLRFGPNRSDLQSSETQKLAEVVQYLRANPSLKLGIDGSLDPRGSEPRNQGLIDQRITAVRNALIQAGVPMERIQTGAFRNPQLARDGQLAVFIRTDI